MKLDSLLVALRASQVAIEHLYPGHASPPAMVATNCHSGNHAGRRVGVVDEDIDPPYILDVVWAMSTRRDPLEDVQLIKRAGSMPLGPPPSEALRENNLGIIDACRPNEWKDEFPTPAEATPALKVRVHSKWPNLYELGFGEASF